MVIPLLMAAALGWPDPSVTVAREPSEGAVPPACRDVRLISQSRGETPPSTLGLQVADGQWLKLFSVKRVDPACGPRIAVFDGGLMLDSGDSFYLVSDVGGERFERQARSIDADLVRRDLSGGDAGPGRFEMAYRVGQRLERGAQRVDYVGLWRTNAGYEVRGFVMREGEVARPARPILRSAVRIRSVGYTPMPDAPAGILPLVLETAPRETTLASLDWQHPRFFN